MRKAGGYAVIVSPDETYAQLDDKGSRPQLIRSGTTEFDSGDIFEIRDAATEAIARIRSGGGPQFLECVTYRWRGHVGPELDYDAGYRAEGDLTPWLEDDQVERLAQMIEPREREEIDRGVERVVAEAVAFAESSPVPDQAELYANVFAR